MINRNKNCETCGAGAIFKSEGGYYADEPPIWVCQCCGGSIPRIVRARKTTAKKVREMKDLLESLVS